MRRHYTRGRKSGPTPERQLESHIAAGLDASVDHPALYADLLNKYGKAGPQIALASAIGSLRPGDQLVVHDAATLGPNAEAINKAMIAIGTKGATLIVWTPEPREYTWDAEAAGVAGEMHSLAVDAAAVLLSEKHQRASKKSVRLGVPRKLVGQVRDIALKHWKNQALSARLAHAAAVAETGVKFSLRLMQQPPDKGGLGRKMDAEVMLDPPRPAPMKPYKPPAKAKAKTKPKRKKARPAKVPA